MAARKPFTYVLVFGDNHVHGENCRTNETQKPVYITIATTESAARALQRKTADTVDSEEIVSAAKDLGVVLEPMHPATDDSELVRDFIVTGFATDKESSIRNAFLHCRGVLGAYSKPKGEEPLEITPAAIDGTPG